MCLALPGQITWIGAPLPSSVPGRVQIGSVEQEVDLVMVPEAVVGDYVIAHSGYAIRLLSAPAAQEAIRLLDGSSDGTFSTTHPA